MRGVSESTQSNHTISSAVMMPEEGPELHKLVLNSSHICLRHELDHVVHDDVPLGSV